MVLFKKCSIEARNFPQENDKMVGLVWGFVFFFFNGEEIERKFCKALGLLIFLSLPQHKSHGATYFFCTFQNPYQVEKMQAKPKYEE